MRYAIPGLLPSFVPLAGCLFLLLVPATATHARITPGDDALEVLNCNDSGAGSLRQTVALAPSGAVIDLTGLDCRRIDLTSGAIEVPQDDLALVGRGISALTIDGGLLSSLIRHSGTGRIAFQGLTLQRGFHHSDTEPALGGCVYSTGAVKLEHARVRWCHAKGGADPFGVGGGIYAEGPVTLLHSQVLGNTARYAGGIRTRGLLKAHHSWICSNHATLAFYGGASAWGAVVTYSTFSGNSGGALGSSGDTVIASSTISGNRSRYLPIISIRPDGETHEGGSALIVNSTISGNRSGIRQTVTLVGWPNSIVNSTIAFNAHNLGPASGDCTSEGTVMLALQQAPLHLESTIIANNTCGGDAFAGIAARDPYHPVVEGADNLVTSSNVPLPPDTIHSDPLLAALATNGGPTRTHALPAGSPAIDMGNNAAGLSYDQRGRGHPRVRGTRADIGAYER